MQNTNQITEMQRKLSNAEKRLKYYTSWARILDPRYAWKRMFWANRLKHYQSTINAVMS